MLNVSQIAIEKLSTYPNNARKHSKRQVSQIARSIKEFGFNNPILIDGNNMVIAGHGRLMAAQSLDMREVPTIRLDHLSEIQKKSYILADNKLAEKAGWDKEILEIEFENLLTLDTDFDLTHTGFETPEIDIILKANNADELDPLNELPDDALVPSRVKLGELWRLGRHFLYCGNSLEPESFKRLLINRRADLIFTDPPYNVKIEGNVSGHGSIQHNDFAFASGEMTKAEFSSFLTNVFANLTASSKDGSIHFVCMDWRHAAEVMFAGSLSYTELKNICVWNKQMGGLGSLYRSQHEFVFVFKNGTAPHTNNIELGKHGRMRTNIWDYYGMSSGLRKDELKLHPTIKPIQMIADAIIDCTKKGDIVLDCFGGSGSTLLAAEKTKRQAYLIEYEPKYCDIILYRYEQMFKQPVERV